MNRPARLVTAALTASAALLLTACGSGGGDDSSSDKIKGADQGSSSTPSASASASKGGADRPEINLPKSFQANFEGWTNSDPKLQAILDDGREQLRAEYAAIIEAKPDSDAVTFYNEGASLQSARKWIQGYVDNNHTLIGKASVFDPQVRISDDGTGVLFYCVDEGKGYTKDRKTGEVKGTPKGQSSRLQYRTRLDKTSQGLWKTTFLETEVGAC